MKSGHITPAFHTPLYKDSRYRMQFEKTSKKVAALWINAMLCQIKHSDIKGKISHIVLDRKILLLILLTRGTMRWFEHPLRLHLEHPWLKWGCGFHNALLLNMLRCLCCRLILMNWLGFSETSTRYFLLCCRMSSTFFFCTHRKYLNAMSGIVCVGDVVLQIKLNNADTVCSVSLDFSKIWSSQERITLMKGPLSCRHRRVDLH